MIAVPGRRRKSPAAAVLASPPMSEAAARPIVDTPSAATSLVALADQCVQCGLCLPTCPTYRLGQIEAESPRGRIALARGWALELIPATAAGETHLDQCLACRRCEVVCPAQVQYGALLLQARQQQRKRRPPSSRQRWLEALMARPRWLLRLLRAYHHLFPLLPPSWRPLPRPPAAVCVDAPGSGRVVLFTGCVARGYESGLQAAVQRLCASVGVTLAVPASQGCCGTLHAHAGDHAAAQALAASNRIAFAGSDTVLTLASGCHEAVASATGNACDALDFLAARADALRFRPAPIRVALHLPCTQRNVVGSAAATRALLARVPGLEVVGLDAGLGCCGAAGSQMLTDPARAAAFRQPLLDQLAGSGAHCVLSANIGCRLHLGNGTALPVWHPLEFLAAHSI